MMGGWINQSVHDMRGLCIGLIGVALTCVLVMPVAGQDETPALPTSEAATEAAGMSLQKLRLALMPKRQDEMYKEADLWVKYLQVTMAALSSAEIRLLNVTTDEERQALVAETDRLRATRSALTERIEVVLDQLRDKGGDAAEFNQYVKAVSGGAPVTIDVTDTKTLWLRVDTWLRSPDGGIKVGLNLLWSVVILTAFWILGAILGGLMRRALQSFKKTSNLLRDFLGGLTRKVTFIVGAVIAVSKLGIDVTPLIAAIGAAGLVVGFALQGTLGNIASGIMILLYRPFDVGDAVSAAGVSGKVISMTMVSTVIDTFDNQRIIVPNNAIWGGVITNITANPTRRVDMTFGISYADDIDKARSILQSILDNHPLVLRDPEPVIRLHTLGESSVDFIVRPWSRTADYWDVYWDVTREVKKRFDAEGVSIPFPQRDVHIRQATA